MKPFLLTVVLVAMAFITHLVVWRVKLPKHHTAALLFIFFAVLVAGVAVGWFVPCLNFRTDPWALAHVALAHIAIALAYAVAYSAIEASSPSMSILMYVYQAGAGGRSEDEVEAAMHSVSPVDARIKAMLHEGMVFERGDELVLTAKGLAWARTLGFWRRLTGAGKGG